MNREMQVGIKLHTIILHRCLMHILNSRDVHWMAERVMVGYFSHREKHMWNLCLYFTGQKIHANSDPTTFKCIHIPWIEYSYIILSAYVGLHLYRSMCNTFLSGAWECTLDHYPCNWTPTWPIQLCSICQAFE